MTGIPAAMLAKIEDTSIPDEKFVAVLLEEGRNARNAAGKAGYNISQGFKTARKTLGGLFGRGQNMTNKNKNMKAAAAVGANGQPKKTWRNKLGNFWGSTKRFFTRSKNGNGKSPFTAPGPSATAGPNNLPVVSNPMYTPEPLAQNPAGLSSNRVRGFNNFRGAGAASRKNPRGGLVIRTPPAASAAARTRKLRR